MTRTDERERLDDNIQRVELEVGVDITPTSLEETFTADHRMVFVDSGVDGDNEAWDAWRRELYQAATEFDEDMEMVVPEGMSAITYEITYPDEQQALWVARAWPEDGASQGGYYIWSTCNQGYHWLPYEATDRLWGCIPTYTNYCDDEGEDK